MMNFELLEASIINLLGNAAGGEFRVIGYQKQAQEAFHIKDKDRSVQVFYLEGDYPKSAGSLSGPTMHDMTFALYMTVSMPAQGDLAAINNPLSTAEEYKTALANLETAEPLVNASWNELKRRVYQILMDARNLDLGLAPTRVANRWIDRAAKDPLQTRGELAILTGSMRLTCRMPEDVPGEVGDPLMVFDTGIEIDGDVIGRAGVYQEHDIVIEGTTGAIVLDPVSQNFLRAA
jgi:hypothetical protein